jgi:hypothetical protein
MASRGETSKLPRRHIYGYPIPNISVVSFRYGQRVYCQRRAAKPAPRRAPFVTSQTIFDAPSFTLGLHLPDSPARAPEIKQIVSSVNGLRPLYGTSPRSFPIASWNHIAPATTGSSEQTGIPESQPILPLFVLTLCRWLISDVPGPG